MRRRTVLKTLGATALAGTAVTGAASATPGDSEIYTNDDGQQVIVTRPDITGDGGDPEVVKFERRSVPQTTYTVETENGPVEVSGSAPPEDTNYVRHVGDGTVEIAGRFSLPNPCSSLEIAGIDSTSDGDVVRLTVTGYEDPCPAVVVETEFRIVLQYDGTPDAVAVEFEDQWGEFTTCCEPLE